MNVSQTISLASWLSFIALLWLVVIGRIELQAQAWAILIVFFVLGLFAGMLSWNSKS